MKSTTYERRGIVHTASYIDKTADKTDRSKWVTRWRSYQTVNGVRKLAYGLTATESETKLAKKLAGPGTVHSIASDPRDLSVRQLLQSWLTYRIEANHLRPASVDVYRYGIELVNRDLGDILVGDLRKGHVEKALDNLRPLSPSARAKAKLVLVAAVDWADDDPERPLANVAKQVRMTSRYVHRQVHRSVAEKDAIIAAMPAGWLRNLTVVSLETGLRQGEALGLTADELDLTRGRLTLRHQLQHLAGGRTKNGKNLGGSYSLTPCKTDDDDEPVGFDSQPFSRRAKEAIEAQLNDPNRVPLEEPIQSPWGPRNDLIFTTLTGRPISGTFVTHSFQTALAGAGLPLIHWHDLRSIYIALAREAGISMDSIARLVHHSSSRVTEQSYLSSTEALQDQDQARFDALTSNHTPGRTT